MLKGILFDIDGVIVDSEPYIAEACKIFFASKGRAVSKEDFLPYVGEGEDRYIGCVAKKYNLDLDIQKAKKEVYQIYDEVALGKKDLPPMKIIKATSSFIAEASLVGLKLALASSADSMKVNINLKHAGLRPEDFGCVVTGSQVERKKPFGDIYTYACSKLGLDPKDCLVVEDAISGCKAAKDAGCMCIGLLGTFSDKDLFQSGADIVLKDLSFFPSFNSIKSFSEAFFFLCQKQSQKKFGVTK